MDSYGSDLLSATLTWKFGSFKPESAFDYVADDRFEDGWLRMDSLTERVTTVIKTGHSQVTIWLRSDSVLR